MAESSLEWVFPVIATVIWLLFFGSVVEQYLRKRKTHQLVWGIALLMVVVVMGAEALSYFLGEWNPWLYRIYYVLAAFQVTILGTGVIYLLRSRELINEQNTFGGLLIFGGIWLVFGIPFTFFVSPVFFVIILLAFLYIGLALISFFTEWNTSGTQFAHLFALTNVVVFGVMMVSAWSSPVDVEILKSLLGHQIGGAGWEESTIVRSFSPLLTVPGAFALIGGALFSYFKLQRYLKYKTGHYNPKTGVFNLFLAGGSLLLATSGVLLRFGLAGTLLLYTVNTLAVILMYFGFLESDSISMHKLIEVLTFQWLRSSETQIS
ncbi:MAG: hypothetical protein ACFFFG_15470 [Candidatus Thorarchaeota archaeon]